MKPFFKWSGGKRREFDIISKYIPSYYNIYYEPFVGGGAIWLRLNPNKSIINDNYYDLINFYKILKTDTDRFVNTINKMSLVYSEKMKNVKFDPNKKSEEFIAIGDEFYYTWRNNDFSNPFDNAIKFYLLRQLSFSGMLRFNKAGKPNVPFNWAKKLKPIMEYSEINKAKYILNNTKIMCGDWKSCVINIKLDDFVFLDPPYTRKFIQYSPNNIFAKKEHIELAKWFKLQDAQKMIIINKDDFTTELYKDYIRIEYDYKYAVRFRNRMTEDDSNSVHMLCTNNYNLKWSKFW